MKKIGVMALLVLVSACGSDKFDRDAIRATVVLEGDIKATCVLLEVRDPADKRVLGRTWLPRAAGDTELRAAIFKASLPTVVELAARPYLDGSCANNTEAQTPNGNFVTGTASFAVGKVVEADDLTLLPGTDADGDGYVGTGTGGSDCNDGVGTVKPGAVESCSDQVDLNCDSKKGCEASSCAAQSCFGPPAAVAVTLPSPLTAGTCTSGGTVTLKDANGVNSRVSVDTSVSLRIAPANSVRFYADAACATPVTSVTIPANTSSASFFVQGQLGGNVTVTAAVTGLTDGTQAAVINPGAGNRLAFQGAAQTVTAGVCSPQPVRIQSQDMQGNAAPVPTLTSVSLSATPDTNFKFYSDAACSNEVTSVNIATQMSTASFYFKGTRSGSVLVAITAMGFTGTSQAQTINAAAPTAIVIVGPVTVAAATCSVAIFATLQDPFGNPATATTNTQLNLISSNAQLALFSNNTCTTTASSLTFAPGVGSRDFFVRSTQAAPYSITATGSGLTNGTVTVTVTAGPPSVLVFTATAQSPLPAGVCSGIVTVQLRDANANPVIAASPTTVSLLASSQGPEFFTNSTCTGTAVTATSIDTGASTASFYFKGTKTVTNAILTAAVDSISATQTVTITAAPPSVLVFTTRPTTAAAGACPQVVLQTQDSFGNPSNVPSPQTVTLTPGPAEGFTFHTANNCNAGSTVSQVTVLSGQNSVTFYARGTKAGQFSLGATSPGLSSASGSLDITALAVNKVVFATSPHVVTADVCSPIVTLNSTDSFGNVVPVSNAESIALSAQAGDSEFRFYSDSNCSMVITGVSIPATQSSASFYFKGEKARTVTVTANATNLVDGTQDQTIVGASATTLRFSASTPPATLLAGTCAVRTVEGLDAFGNPSTNALTLTLTGSTSAEFFSDSNCTVPATQVSIAAGMGSVSFSFKGLTGGSNASAPLTLTAASTQPLSAMQNESILPTVRTGNCSIGSTNSNVTCTIAPALSSTARAFLTFQATSAATDPGGANVRCHFNSTSQVRCERGDNNGGVANIQWAAAEFPTGVNVQHQTPACTGDVTSVNFSALVRDNTFLLLSSRRDDTEQGNSVPRLAELKSSTLAEIRKTGGCVGTDANALQAVEYAGASVQRSATTAMASNATSQEAMLSPGVDATRSIVLFSFLNDGSGNSICNRALRGELTNNGGRVRFSRAEGSMANNCAASNVSAISWEVIQFPVGTVVRQVTQPLAAAAASANITLQPPVDASRTIVLMSGQGSSGQAGGEGRHSSSEAIGEMRARAVLSADGTTVTLTRDSSTSQATFTVYVVQLKP
ncbi:MAG TPA: MopE-related protein [Myxococcaceae bacterium]|nr:MopE-related protein [Myxococcaceae bacterium]